MNRATVPQCETKSAADARSADRPIPPIVGTGKLPTLSVVIPVYNERRWIREAIARVLAAPFHKQIIIIDDGSTDGTRGILDSLGCDVQVIHQPLNRGKGAAIRTALKYAAGDFVLIQDADLEYDPADYARLLRPLIEGRADVVYGSRMLARGNARFSWPYFLANQFITALSNLCTGLRLTDVETCYKVFRRDVLANIRLQSNRFAFDPEITVKIARRRHPPLRIHEVPINYHPRTVQDGKKIRSRDLIAALWCIVRFSLLD